MNLYIVNSLHSSRNQHYIVCNRLVFQGYTPCNLRLYMVNKWHHQYCYNHQGTYKTYLIVIFDFQGKSNTQSPEYQYKSHKYNGKDHKYCSECCQNNLTCMSRCLAKPRTILGIKMHCMFNSYPYQYICKIRINHYRPHSQTMCCLDSTRHQLIPKQRS